MESIKRSISTSIIRIKSPCPIIRRMQLYCPKFWEEKNYTARTPSPVFFPPPPPFLYHSSPVISPTLVLNFLLPFSHPSFFLSRSSIFYFLIDLSPSPLTTLDKISHNINSSIKKGRQISPPSSKLQPKA